MNFKSFLKDKLLATILLLVALATIEIFLLAYPPTFLLFYIPLIILVTYFLGLALEYFARKKFYDNLTKTLNDLNEKYLFTELIKTPSFAEGKILKNVLSETNKSMLENVHGYQRAVTNYKEYIELWIHEIKIPIATSKLVIENHKSEVAKSLAEELDKIEDYTEQALYYARSSAVEKDYFIKKVKLAEIVNESVKHYKNFFIRGHTKIDLHNLDQNVYTDSKWLVFILNQLLSNSIKYKKPNEKLTLEISATRGKENVTLALKDNGLGIKESELARVFEKGFTGENGRRINKKSTGIGLYLAKKLCEKLGLKLELESQENRGTTVKIVFPKDSRLELK